MYASMTEAQKKVGFLYFNNFNTMAAHAMIIHIKPYKRQSQAAKAQCEPEAWKRTLTSDDIRRENAFCTAQRKAGKSRRGNIKDTNAPKKPLSACFMFLQHIRADAGRFQGVFGSEKETTAQSVLAVQK